MKIEDKRLKQLMCFESLRIDDNYLDTQRKAIRNFNDACERKIFRIRSHFVKRIITKYYYQTIQLNCSK